jgi:hypothetical protein
MSCVIFNSAAPAEATPLMAMITKQRKVELLMRFVAREISLEIASQHHQKLSDLLFLDHLKMAVRGVVISPSANSE